MRGAYIAVLGLPPVDAPSMRPPRYSSVRVGVVCEASILPLCFKCKIQRFRGGAGVCLWLMAVGSVVCEQNESHNTHILA